MYVYVCVCVPSCSPEGSAIAGAGPGPRRAAAAARREGGFMCPSPCARRGSAPSRLCAHHHATYLCLSVCLSTCLYLYLSI